jgi:hypothetical protein
MSTIPPILVKLQADISGLKAGLAQAEAGIKNLDSNVKTASSGMSNFTKQLKSVGAALGVAFAGAQLAGFAKNAVLAASTMNESISKVQVVFSNTSDEILKWGKTAADTMGISNQKALEAAGTYGNLFQALGITKDKSQEMSTTMVQLAADLASFNNTSVDDALNALRSGLSGETEPLKRFGVALNDVTLKNKALAMGLIQTTSGVLPPAIKAQVTYALVMEQTKLAQGDYARTSEGTANTIKTLQARFQDASVAVGNMLLPALNLLLKIATPLVKIMEKMATFVNENRNALAAFAIVIGVATTAWAAYTVVVKRAAIAQAVLNGIMAINPIGALVTAVALLAAGLVVLWNRSETFRKIIVSVMQAGVNAVAAFLRAIGVLVEKLSGIPVIGKKFQGLSNDIKTSAARLSDFSAGLDKLATKTKTGPLGNFSMSTGKVLGSETPGAGTPPVDASALDKARKKAEAEAKTNKTKLATLNKQLRNYEEDKAKLQDDYARKVAKRMVDYDDDVAKIKKNNAEAVANAQAQYAKKVVDLTKDYNKQIIDAEKDAADKRRNIIQQSIDRLRDVFKSASALDIGKSFSDLLKGEDPTKATTGGLVEKFKEQLAKVKLLADNASALAKQGFSQVFIEQVVSQGGDVGNQLANEILKSTPESIAELQQVYSELEATSQHGVDALGVTMNSGMKLATEELVKAYAQVQIDLDTKLAEFAMSFAESMAEAKTNLNETLTSLAKDLQEALAEAQKNLDRDLAEMADSFQRAMAEINKSVMETIVQITALMSVMSGLTGLGSKGGGGTNKPSKPNSNLPDFYPGTFTLRNANSTKEPSSIIVNSNFYNSMNNGTVVDSIVSATKFGQIQTINGVGTSV